MNFHYSKTETIQPAKDEDGVEVKLESNPTHHVIKASWAHCNSENTVIKVTNHPFKVEANSYDGVNYHKLEFNLALNHPVASLDNAYYDFDEKGFRIHIPRENFVVVQKETASVPLGKS